MPEMDGRVGSPAPWIIEVGRDCTDEVRIPWMDAVLRTPGNLGVLEGFGWSLACMVAAACGCAAVNELCESPPEMVGDLRCLGMVDNPESDGKGFDIVGALLPSVETA
jgi:hypothetical protein